jgi:hypothetical protein
MRIAWKHVGGIVVDWLSMIFVLTERNLFLMVQLETVLAKHPGVLAATVIPDEQFNEVVAAVS